MKKDELFDILIKILGLCFILVALDHFFSFIYKIINYSEEFIIDTFHLGLSFVLLGGAGFLMVRKKWSEIQVSEQSVNNQSRSQLIQLFLYLGGLVYLIMGIKFFIVWVLAINFSILTNADDYYKLSIGLAPFIKLMVGIILIIVSRKRTSQIKLI